MCHITEYILTGEDFCFDEASLKVKPSICNATKLMIGRIFHRLVSGSVCFKPHFSSTNYMLLGLRISDMFPQSLTQCLS